MNIYSLNQDSVVLNEIGYALDTPQRIKLEMGLLKLTQQANADQLLFWGKIYTTSQPYYIAIAIDFKGHFAFPHKKFYYATDNFNFKELPQVDKFNISKANDFNLTPFTGNPATILVNIQGDGEALKQVEKKQGEDEDSEDEQIEKIVPKNFTEQDRIAYTVNAIEIECQIVQKGSYKMIPEHEIRYNENFKSSKQLDLTNFVHFRYPQTQNAQKFLESIQSIFRIDIFDPIENSSFWSIQSNTENNLISVRSLLWQGYVSYVHTKRNIFGGIYFGNGLKNADLPFYI